MMHRINNGRSSKLEDFEILEEPESIVNRQRVLHAKESRFPLLKSIWIQTAPLFRPPYLFSTILICTIQLGIYATSNGFYMLVPEILNKISSNVDWEDRMPMCSIINMRPVNVTAIEFDEVSIKENFISIRALHFNLLSIYLRFNDSLENLYNNIST